VGHRLQYRLQVIRSVMHLSKGKAKAYQIKQVLMAIEKLEDDHVSKK
jgi:hypothetical protein